MSSALSTTDFDLSPAILKACLEVQGRLFAGGIPSVLVDPGGRMLGSRFEEPSDSACRSCVELFREEAGTEPRSSSAGLAEPAVQPCSQGHYFVSVPIRHRKETQAHLVCCLKSLRYRKTETLESFCGRFALDSQLLVEAGLKDALSLPAGAALLDTLASLALDQSLRHSDACQELEDLTHSLSQSYEEITLLHRISDGMKLTQKPQTFFADICEHIRDVVQTQKILILWNESDSISGIPQVVQTTGEPVLSGEELLLLWSRTRAETSLPAGILRDSAAGNASSWDWPESIRSLVSIPLRRNDKTFGALAALNTLEKPDFDSIDTKLLISVSNELAVYLDNFRLYGDLQDLMVGSLRALTRSIDAKDPYTCGHSERVAMIARSLAQQMHLSAEQVHEIYLAGLLHDVGKIGVSEQVLRKPGKLLPDEFQQIQKHPQVGANILMGLKPMSEVTRAVLTHHERYDGKGYPSGLKGKTIPLAGRIVKLADSFDAMISARVYRQALPLAAVLAEIRTFSGTHFDPAIAEAFLGMDIPKLLGELEAIQSGPESGNGDLGNWEKGSRSPRFFAASNSIHDRAL